MLALWTLFAPTALGGQANYIIVAGASMEPALRQGDLVIVRQAPSYEVGEVVTYQDPKIGPVIHRILRRDGARYILKGDSNHWIDSFEPSEAQILGKQWVRLPRVGAIFVKARQPAAVAGAAFLFMFVGVVMPTLRDQDKKRAGFSARGARQRLDDAGMEGLLFLFGALLFGAILLGLYAFNHPLQVTRQEEIPYSYQSTFTYHAPGPAEVYSAGQVRTGESVFTRLVDQVEFQYAFHISSQAGSQVQGNYQMVAVIRDTTGWERPIPLGPVQSFRGDGFEARAVLDLPAIWAEIQRFQELTDHYLNGYQLVIEPRITLWGRVGDQPLQENYRPQMIFMIDEVQMRLIAEETLRPGQAWVVRDERMMVQEYTEPGTLKLFLWQVPVAAARGTATFGAGIGLLGLIWLGIVAWRASSDGEHRRIELRYGSMLVEVTNHSISAAKRKVEVASIDDLARVAEGLGRLILYKRQKGDILYGVEVSGVYYVYRLPLPQEPRDWRKGSASGGKAWAWRAVWAQIWSLIIAFMQDRSNHLLARMRR
jgi:signal peptidase I